MTKLWQRGAAPPATKLSQTRHESATTAAFNKDMKKRLLLVLIAISAISASVAAYYRSTGSENTPQFTTAAVSRGDVVESVESTGTSQAVTTVQVGTQVSGTIQSLHADFNSQVKKGQVIARLDPSVMDAQVEQAQASVARLQADVERSRVEVDDTQNKLRRAKELFEQGLIPATELENAETAARQAQASLKSAQAQVTQANASLNQNRSNLSHTVITAPVDGIVISRTVDVGQTVAASMSAPTLFEIARDLTDMQVNASIDESDIGRIQPGQAVTFRVDAFPRRDVQRHRLAGALAARRRAERGQLRDGHRRAEPRLKLKPGMTANVTIEIARADDVLRVPNAALRFRPTAGCAAGRAKASRAQAPQEWSGSARRPRAAQTAGAATRAGGGRQP